MIEITIREYLKIHLAPVPVKLEKLTGRPSKYVLVERVGSSCANGIKKASIAIQSYGSSLYEAAELNELVKGKMMQIDRLDSVSNCELESDYNFTDTTTKEYRYQAVYEITYV